MPILAKTYQGINGGMNQAVPQHEIPDGQASYMQDIILNFPGIIKRRGPLTKVSGSSTVPFRATGIFATQDPLGAYKVGVLAGSAAAANAYFYASNLATKVGPYQITPGLTGFDPAAGRYRVDAKPALNTGTFVGISSGYLPGAEAAMFYWRGATLGADITTLSCAATLGSATVTTITAGGFTNVTPGMFIYRGAQYIGTVLSVQSGTSLTMETAYTTGTFSGFTLNFKPIRPLIPKVMKGRISIAPGSLIVNGTQGPQGTKFKSQGVDVLPGTGSTVWSLFRLSDDFYIGDVSGVTDNATLTLATIPGNQLPTTSPGMTNERYYLRPSDTTGIAKSFSLLSDVFLSKPLVGFLNTVWNGRQWYANLPLVSGGNDQASRIWFSDPADPEGLDLSADDGDFIDVGSTTGPASPITAIQGIPTGLVVFKESELFMVTGSDYTNFSVRKIGDVGAFELGSVQVVGAGVIFAGRDGIFYFDGQQLRNLTAALGDYWTQSIKGFTPTTNRMGSYIWKNQYVLFMDSFASTYTLRKAAATTTPSSIAFCIDLDTFAITTFTNMAIKDSTTMPPASGFPTLAVVDDGGTPGVTSIIDTSLIHSITGSGPDTITCGGQTIGPDFYLESKKYDLGDPERKKLFKQLAMNYILAGNTLSMDTVPGLNTTGTAINTPWATQASWTNLRKKFTKRDTHLQFRFYQGSSAVTDVQIGPLAIGFKLQRVGRV